MFHEINGNMINDFCTVFSTYATNGDLRIDGHEIMIKA